MSHANNKVEWCLRKAEKELKEHGQHRGLVKGKPSKEDADKHITKAEHYFKATKHLKQGKFSDISVSTMFYCMYQSLLAIARKFGYESRNQECTFALIQKLSEDKSIDFDQNILEKIAVLDVAKPETAHEKTSVELREEFQYGTSLAIDETLYNQLIQLTQDVLSRAKEIVEE